MASGISLHFTGFDHYDRNAVEFVGDRLSRSRADPPVLTLNDERTSSTVYSAGHRVRYGAEHGTEIVAK